MSDALLAAVRDFWGWRGMQPEAVLAISPFGHLIVQDRASAYWYLDPEMRTLEPVATDEAGLFAHMNEAEVREVWLAEALVERARDAIGTPEEGCCYSLSIPALLRGDYASNDFWHPPVAELIGAMGDIERQMRDLPDGSVVELKVKD